ncbi:class III signal peptide-containing protein [Thermococcus sp. 2319x1]|uniref:class III signal peptide-containing protein n=1 Tax=Thermococcus sp. 2319x1 TaxID=1674923 RepID=UPI0009E960FA|nr:class III signal peptide-containing protein [Thermococcus sp. 2319x1]
MSRKGQGSLEYLFMVAAALIIIFAVVSYISGSGSQATQQGDIALLQSQAELAKSKLTAKGLWNDEYCFYILSESYSKDKVGSKYGISIKDKGSNGKCDKSDRVIYYLDYSGSEYREEVKALYGDGKYNLKTLKELYDQCLAGDENACKVIITLDESLWIPQ